jgi:hypothetical protein
MEGKITGKFIAGNVTCMELRKLFSVQLGNYVTHSPFMLGDGVRIPFVGVTHLFV